MLSSIYIKADQIEQHLPNSNITRELKEMVIKSIHEARSISHNLSPPHLEELGLYKAIKAQLDAINQENKLKINYLFEISVTLNKNLELIIYRILGELLHNIVKHSEASEVLISLKTMNNQLELIVEDDGKGIDFQKINNGIGLKNIRERLTYLKGDFHIDSNEKGTTIIILIPV
jgi:signal transduction histidine kinase